MPIDAARPALATQPLTPGWRKPRLSRREARLQVLRWRKRVIFLFGGCLVGVGGVVMALGANAAYSQFERLLTFWPHAPLIVTPLGFACLTWITRRFFPNSEGSGIPQAIAARKLWGARERGKLVSLRLALGKIALTLAGLLCGASIGREGPTVQVGAAVMYTIGRLSPARQPGLILAGASAGIAAAFNTPLAGVLFGIEEMSRSFDERANGLIIGAIIAAGIVSVAVLGNYTYFGVTSSALNTSAGWAAIPICGIAGGLFGGVFSRILIAVARGLPGPIGRSFKRHPVLFATGCGFAVALCGLASHDTIFGTGYPQVKALIDHGEPLPLSFALLKMVATTFSSIAGIPGGLFSPSLAVGAGIGYDVSRLLPGVPVGAVVLLGMVGYFSGVVQAPITAFVIVEEMTADNSMMVPLMASSLIGAACSRLLCAEGVYHILSRNYLRLYAPEVATPAPGAAVAVTPTREPPT